MLAANADLNSRTDDTDQAHMRDLDSAEPALEVIVLWGDHSVLHAVHLSPPRAFYVGESSADGTDAVDFVLGADGVGSGRWPITVQAGGETFAVVPAGATGYVEHGDELLSFSELLAQGMMQPCAELSGATQVRLSRDTSARIEYRGFCFLVRPTLAARRIGVASGLPVDWQASRFTFGSVALHLVMLGLFYFAPPSSTVLAIDRLGMDSRMTEYLVTPDETVLPEPSWDAMSDTAHTEGGEPGQAEAGESGEAGKRDAPKTKHRFAVAGPADNDDPQLPRDLMRELQEHSIIGILKANVGDMNAPTSPFGKLQAEGADPMSAIGAVFGDVPGMNGGADGLGMVGTGRHGGGYAATGTVGVGNVGTIGVGGSHGDGSGYGTGVGFRRREGGGLPIVRPSKADVSGSLSKEVIRRVVARHLSEVRYCYQQALQARPELQGRVSVKFVIGTSGVVTLAFPAGSDVDDREVPACIVDAVKRWTFPAPEGGGIVTVTYPFVLQQAGG